MPCCTTSHSSVWQPLKSWPTAIADKLPPFWWRNYPRWHSLLDDVCPGDSPTHSRSEHKETVNNWFADDTALRSCVDMATLTKVVHIGKQLSSSSETWLQLAISIFFQYVIAEFSRSISASRVGLTIDDFLNKRFHWGPEVDVQEHSWIVMPFHFLYHFS